MCLVGGEAGGVSGCWVAIGIGPAGHVGRCLLGIGTGDEGAVLIFSRLRTGIVGIGDEGRCGAGTDRGNAMVVMVCDLSSTSRL